MCAMRTILRTLRISPALDWSTMFAETNISNFGHQIIGMLLVVLLEKVNFIFVQLLTKVSDSLIIMYYLFCFNIEFILTEKHDLTTVAVSFKVITEDMTPEQRLACTHPTTTTSEGKLR